METTVNRALVAVLVFISVTAIVTLQAWILNRSTKRRLPLATFESAEPSGANWLERRPTPFQKRLYIGSLFVSTALFLAGLVLTVVEDEPSGLSFGLVLAAVAIVLLRFIAFKVLRYAALRSYRLKNGRST